MIDARSEAIAFEGCLDLLRNESVARVAIVADGFPILLPVKYRLVETSAATWIALRTRPGSVIDRAVHAAFEIDGIDAYNQEGWSVLVRGMLHHVDADAADFRSRFDPEPWMLDERDAWLVMEPFSIAGRRLKAATREWAFHARAYL